MALGTTARHRRRDVEHRWTSEKYRRRFADAPVACRQPPHHKRDPRLWLSSRL